MPEHTSNAPHVGQSAQLYTELLEAKRLLANALAERDRLRDAARAFLALLDRTTFSSVSLKGKELDALRRECRE